MEKKSLDIKDLNLLSNVLSDQIECKCIFGCSISDLQELKDLNYKLCEIISFTK